MATLEIPPWTFTRGPADSSIYASFNLKERETVFKKHQVWWKYNNTCVLSHLQAKHNTICHVTEISDTNK